MRAQINLAETSDLLYLKPMIHKVEVEGKLKKLHVLRCGCW